MKRTNWSVAAFCLLLISSSSLWAQQEPVLKAEVENVVLNVLVTDGIGRPIPGLSKENFRVFEDKVEQKVTSFFPVDAPFSVILVLDTSFSTYGKLAPIQNSAIEFIDQIHPQDQVSVISFDDDVYLETDFTENKDKAARAVKQTRTGQSTKLFDAVFLSLEQISSQPYRKVMVVFSDGIDTTSSDTSRGETIKVAREAETTIYSIQFDTRNQMMRPQSAPIGTPGSVPGSRTPIPGGTPFPMPGPTIGGGGMNRGEIEQEYMRGRRYLQELAEVTGGDTYEAEENLGNLSSIFAQIADEMRSLYSLSYVSTNLKRDGKFRKVQVKVVDVPDARARTRKGYSVPKSKDRQ